MTFITVAPIKPKDVTPEERTHIEFTFAHWRFHLWGKNIGSYNEIEQMVDEGKLKLFICPDAGCDCKFPKSEQG